MKIFWSPSRINIFSVIILIIYLSYIYLGSSVCHIPVIFLSVVVAERSSILLVLIIKLTKETRWRVCKGRDYRDGEIGDGRLKREGVNRLFNVK